MDARYELLKTLIDILMSIFINWSFRSLFGLFFSVPINNLFILQKLPFYRIFVADSRSPRDGRHLEQVGHYDPVPGKDGNKHVGLNIERIRYWLSVGAQPSDTVARLLGQAGVIPRPPLGMHKGRIKSPDKYKK